MYETLFIDGIDVAGLVSCVQKLDGLFITPSSRGSNIVIPGVDGEVHVDKPFEAGTVTAQLVLAGSTTGGFSDAYRQLRSVVRPGRRVQLVRQLSTTTGYEQHVAWGEYMSGLEPELQLARVGKVALTMKVLSGLWYGIDANTIGTGAVTVLGDARTRRIVVSMSAGTLANATTGTSLTFSGPDPIDIDVESMTATNSLSIDVSEYLTWSGLFPLELDPGVNNLTGTASISYRAAYL